MGDFRKLEVWRLSQALAVEVYRGTAAFPKSELFGLTAQMRRAAASIPANLAEGCGRRRDSELRRFARISLGSACELESHMLLARELAILDRGEFDRLADRIHRIQGMLHALLASLPDLLATRT